MATYKYSANLAYNDDTQLWKEMLLKEQFIQGQHDNLNKPRDLLAGGHAFSTGPQEQQRLNKRNKDLLQAVYKNDLYKTQKSGFYQTSYLRD